MKRFLTFIVAMFMVFGMATAQTTVNEGVFSHMYIGINGGVNQSTVSDYEAWKVDFNNGLKSLTYNAGIELGKDVTPITGFSLQANVAPIYEFNETEPGSHEFTNEGKWKVNRTDLFGNVKFNLMNLFGGYKGYPRRVEIKTVTGIGWNHYFDVTEPNYTPNDIALQGGLEFDFNLGKNRNWYITFTPMVQANKLLKSANGENPNDEIQLAARDADLKANLGILYRFGKGDQNHSFKICDKVYTEQQYADLYTMYDECISRPVQVDTVIIEKTVTEVVEKNNILSNTIIVFTKNSSELTEAEIHRLNIIMSGLDKESTYMVVGSADSATGTEEINTRLANERANVVKDLMNKNGFNDVTTEIQIDAINDQDITRCAIIRIK